MASRESPANEGSNESSSSDAVRMHRLLLYLQPRYTEQEYFCQLEAFDLVNCLIAPVFFANALSLWTRGVLSSVYCAVLLIKGYQMGLLLLPTARQVHAHKHARYWLILGERVLRQCFATPLLGRGPRFQAWLVQQAAKASKMMFCMRLLLLMSGLTISFWNAFCLQLDFVSNVCVTVIFFCIHFQANCTQIAYVFQLLVERVPHLLLLQQGTERVLATAAQLLRTVVLMQPAAACASATGASAAAHSSCSSESQRMTLAAAEANTCSSLSNEPPFAVGTMLFERPQPAPDFDSVAGRFILTCCTTYMVFAVLFLPLYLSWRIERSWKSRWMANLPEVQQQQQLLQQYENGEQSSGMSGPNVIGAVSGSSRTAACPATASTSRADRSGGGKCQQQPIWRSLLLPWQWQCAFGNRSSSSKSSSFVYPPVVFDIAPPADTLAKHLLLMLGISLGVAAAATALCTWYRPLSQVVFTWQQVVKN